MATLDASLVKASSAFLSSPDDLSMFEIFDDDVDIDDEQQHALGGMDLKREMDLHRLEVDTASATDHALDVLASLDSRARGGDTNSSPENDSGDQSPGNCSNSNHGKTKMSAEEKKRRNRDCMRRLRNRRNELIVTMRAEIQLLEAQLNQQLEIANGAAGGAQNPEKCPVEVERRHQALKRLQLDHARVKTAMRRLREENYWLQKQIAQRQESLDAVQQLVQARHEACPPIDMDALDEEDVGIWIRNTDHFFTPLEDSRAFEIVMESYRIIQEGIRVTEKLKGTPNAVLGWSDQRGVDTTWAHFMMQKTFPHESPRELALKTWRLMSSASQISAVQPKAHEMKVLQRLNENTLVIARHNFFDDAKFSYCLVYLYFLLETENGFVVGSRSLDVDEQRMKAFTRENGMVVAKPFHCFHFQSDAASGGCKLTFAGRVDNVIPGCAKHCAMDMLLSMMRWESHCVSPLWQLAS